MTSTPFLLLVYYIYIYIYIHLNSVDADGNRIYKELSYDCTEKFVLDVAEAVGKAAINKVIDDDLADLLLVDSPKAGNIYFLPKIHKEIQPPPGRPICNTINTPTMNLSKWVDMQLQPLVKKQPSYLKDDNDFLRKIDNLNKTQTIPPSAILVTWDVRSLYTNIPHKEGLDALQKTLEYENVPEIKIDTILDFSKLVLTCNNFKFLGQNYLQMSGTAMGTKMAPWYANIFMSVFEKQMLSSYHHKPFVYFHYIDDIFMIWTEGKDSLKEFLKHCNRQNKHIQFTESEVGTTVPFLDFSVSLQNEKLHTDLYCKPTDKHQYLYYSSCHPKHTKNSLSYSLGLRLRRICSTDELFSLRTKEMKQHLLNRGYTKGCINDAINKASTVTREDSLKENIEQKKLQRVPFVITYNPLLPSIPKLLKKSHTILEASEKCSEIFKYIPLVSYRRGRNLSDMLCSKRMPPQTNANKENPNRNDQNKKEDGHNSNQANALSVVSPLKTKKVLKSNAPPNIDENKTLPHPLDSGLVTQTHDAKHAKKDSFIQPSQAQKTARNIKLNSH